MSWHAIEKPVNWSGIAKAEADLQRYYASFPCRSAAVQREAERMIAELRANPPRPNETPPRLNDGEEYELERFPFETFVDGMRSPGV
jgi:hypothetical protein